MSVNPVFMNKVTRADVEVQPYVCGSHGLQIPSLASGRYPRDIGPLIRREEHN